MKEALRAASQKPLLDDKVYPDDPIFGNIERASKVGKKTQWSVDHDKIRNLKGKKFESLHPGFNYREDEHEASRYLFGDSKAKKIQKKK